MHPAMSFHRVRCRYPQCNIAPWSPCRRPVDAATAPRNMFTKMFLVQELSVMLNPHQAGRDARQDGRWRQELQYISHQHLDVIMGAPTCQC